MANETLAREAGGEDNGRVTIRIASLAALLATLLGCGGGQRTPSDAARAYASALERGDFKAAYDLMDASYRARHTRAAYVAEMKSRPDDVASTVKRLRALAGRQQYRAVVDDGRGARLEWVWSDGSWRLAKDPLDLYSQATPRDALRAFVLAATHRRYDIVLRLVPTEWAKAMTAAELRADFEGAKRAERKKLIERLSAHLDDPIDQLGPDRAVLSYGESEAVEFVRERGIWKIVDPD